MPYRILLIITLIAASVNFNCNDYNGRTVYTGPYLGQTPPGLRLELFAPGFVSTGLNESRPAFTPDGKELYFCLVVRPTPSIFTVTIVTTKIVEGEWSSPEVAAFSGKYSDYAPCIHPDGTRFYFQSDRPGSGSDSKHNIWFMEREGDDWGEPKPIGAPINGLGNVFCPSVTLDGTMYFTRSLEDGGQYIFRSRYVDGKYQEPEKLPENVNTVKAQFDATIAPDESFMILPVYGREDAVGSTDFYITFRNKDDKWSDIVNLGKEYNTRGVDGMSSITADGKYLFIVSSDLNYVDNSVKTKFTYKVIQEFNNEPGHGSTDIYWVDVKALEKFRPVGF